MKNSKKLIMSLGTMASIAAPLATVVACGDEVASISKSNFYSNELKIGIEAGKFNDERFQDIVALFEARTGVTVKHVDMGNDRNAYDTVSDMPDIGLQNDNFASAEAEEREFFEAINPAELGKAQYSIFGQSTDLLDGADFYQGMWQATRINSDDEDVVEGEEVKGQQIGIPVGHEAKVLMLRDSFIDQTKNIIAVVPSDGSDENKNFETLDTGVVATLENINDFVNGVGTNGVTFGQSANETLFDAAFSGASETFKAKWLEDGAAAMYQRLGSLASIMEDSSVLNGAVTANTPYTGQQWNAESGEWEHDDAYGGVNYSLGQDINLPYELIASLPEIYDGTMLDSDMYLDLFDGNGFGEHSFQDGDATSTINTEDYLWDAFYGYYQAPGTGDTIEYQPMVDPVTIGEPGSGEVLFRHHGLATANHTWIHGAVRNGLGSLPAQTKDESDQPVADGTKDWEGFGTAGTSVGDNETLAIPLPYGEAPTSSMGVLATDDEKVRNTAYSFIRLMNTNDEADINDGDSWAYNMARLDQKRVMFNNVGSEAYFNYYEGLAHTHSLGGRYMSIYTASIQGGRKLGEGNVVNGALFNKWADSLASFDGNLTGTFRERTTDGMYGIFKDTIRATVITKLDQTFEMTRSSLTDMFEAAFQDAHMALAAA